MARSGRPRRNFAKELMKADAEHERELEEKIVEGSNPNSLSRLVFEAVQLVIALEHGTHELAVESTSVFTT